MLTIMTAKLDRNCVGVPVRCSHCVESEVDFCFTTRAGNKLIYQFPFLSLSSSRLDLPYIHGCERHTNERECMDCDEHF